MQKVQGFSFSRWAYLKKLKRIKNKRIGCAACAVCLFPYIICAVDGPVPIADAAGSTAGSKTSLASASFI